MSLSTGSQRRPQPLASARFPAAVSSASGTGGGALRCHIALTECRVLRSCAPQGLAPVGRAGHSSGARGGQHRHRLLPATIPMGWPVAALCHLWAALEALGHLDCVRLGQATPVGCLWGAALAGASPPCSAVLGQEAAPSPARCLRVPGPQGTGKSGVSFERAPAVTGAGKDEAGWLLLL